MRIPPLVSKVEFLQGASWWTEVTSSRNPLVDASHSQFTDIGGAVYNINTTFSLISRVESGRNDGPTNDTLVRRLRIARDIFVLLDLIIIGVFFCVKYALFCSTFTIEILIVLLGLLAFMF